MWFYVVIRGMDGCRQVAGSDAFLRDNPLYSVCLHRISFLYDNGDMSVSSYDLFGKNIVAFLVKTCLNC